MPALIFLILLVFITIFWLQNPQIIALVFFGSPILQFSLGTWSLIFALLGLITSFFIQILARGSLSLQNKTKKQRPQPPFTEEEREEKPASRPSKWGQRSEPRSYRESEPEPKTEDDEWEIETPPRPTAIPSTNPVPQQAEEQPIKTEPRQPSVYSYSPSPESKEEPIKPKKIIRPETKDREVYDANYRVINPPYENPAKKKTEENTDEEDWI